MIRVKDKVDFFVEICKIANKVMRVKDKVDFFEKTYVLYFYSKNEISNKLDFCFQSVFFTISC